MPDNSSKNQPESTATTRRGFLSKTSALLTGLALADSSLAQSLCPAAGGPPAAGGSLVEVGEIKSVNNVLTAIVRVDDEAKGIWLGAANSQDSSGFAKPFCSEKQQMRYFAGSTADGRQVWPATPGLPAPGPTLRARVGDQVQITLLNHVNVKHFPGTIDQAEQGISKGCDVSSTLTPDANGVMKKTEIYPGTDKEPDCFHGSSSANIHFHGFHVSPDTIADNVLVQVRPSPRDAAGKPVVTEQSVRASFKQVFEQASHGHGPKKWGDLPPAYTTTQKSLLQQYDKTLPPAVGKLWPANEKAIAQGQWPQYYIGAYPFSFKITEPAKPIGPGMPNALMGQCPGTHWYHAHKHGSTALNSFNGMSGVFIVEGEFDDKLRTYYGNQLTEKVLVIQQFSAGLNLMNAVGNAPATSTFSSTKEPLIFVNGVRQPILNMRPGEVQRWRILNASAQVQVGITGMVDTATGGPAAVTWRQIARDGVQYAYANYNVPNPAPNIAPGNRVDLLVQAPSSPGNYTLQTSLFPFPGAGSVTTLLSIHVAGDPLTAKPFPTEDQYPKPPDFLNDIDPTKIHIRRDITFATTPGIGRQPGGGPTHTINGKQFSNDDIDQVMMLNSYEEWTLYNSAGRVQHPFHIHVNPFQIVEVFDPSLTMQQVLQAPYVWADTVAIPAASGGKPGYVRIRQRFADFMGLYVFHCHILAHEDRGMMQLIEVVNNKTIQEHYH